MAYTYPVESRKYFVEQVAQTILENHQKDGDSFIFGISGKWGEGKTFFLRDLEKEIKNTDPTFEVLWINPWKFASDKISFLRAFLAKIPSPDTGFLKKAMTFFRRDPSEFKDLYFDVSREAIDWRMIVLLGLYICLGLTLYFFAPQMPYVEGIYKSIPAGALLFLKIIGISLVIPIGLAIFKSLSTYQQGSKTVSTIDRFDDLLKIKLNENKERKFLVYIDDLDRVTPTVARDVLDNLRTFFDKSVISFIVAGDHTVLERYMGAELLPNGDPADQLEEGRRYLKKIFNVYWRLPPPISTELNKFITGDLFDPAKDSLKKIFPEDKIEQDKFATFLGTYFEGNFRQIIRFFELVLFTFQIIEKKKEAVPEKEKLYFDELIKNPLLVIRILMIQENCTPLFEVILKDQEVLLKLEDAVEKKNTPRIQEILNQYKLSENQKTFINKFLFEEPRFYKDSSLVVSDLRPFLLLAADSSFGDGRGPSPEDFIKILNTGNPSSLKSTILSSGAPKLEQAADSFVKQFAEAGVGPQQSTLLTTLITALKEIPETHNSHNIFAQKIKNFSFTFAEPMSTPERLSFFQLCWSWLDSFVDQTIYADFQNKFSTVNPDDFFSIKLEANVGVFSTEQITKWLNQFYSTDRLRALNKFIEIQNYLDKKTAIANLDPVLEELTGDIVNNGDVAIKDLAIQVLTFANKLNNARGPILERVQNLEQSFWNWSKGQVSSVPGLKLTNELLETSVIEKLDKMPGDFAGLVSVLNFASNNNFISVPELWDKIIKKDFEIFHSQLPHFAQGPLPALTPDKKVSKELFSVIFEKTKEQNALASGLRWLRKDIWLWQNMDKIPNQKTIENLTKDVDPNISQAAKELLASWGISSS